jgi:hypothetical protein
MAIAEATNWGSSGGWNDNTANTYPDLLEIDFNGSKTLDEINVFTLQDNYTSPVDPTSSTVFTLYGVRDFQVQYWTGAAWQDVPGGAGNEQYQGVAAVYGCAITTTKIRVYVTNAMNGYTRLTEVEAWGVPATTRTNVALASNGATATASSIIGSSYAAAIDYRRRSQRDELGQWRRLE